MFLVVSIRRRSHELDEGGCELPEFCDFHRLEPCEQGVKGRWVRGAAIVASEINVETLAVIFAPF